LAICSMQLAKCLDSVFLCPCVYFIRFRLYGLRYMEDVHVASSTEYPSKSMRLPVFAFKKICVNLRNLREIKKPDIL